MCLPFHHRGIGKDKNISAGFQAPQRLAKYTITKKLLLQEDSHHKHISPSSVSLHTILLAITCSRDYALMRTEKKTWLGYSRQLRRGTLVGIEDTKGLTYPAIYYVAERAILH